MTPQQWRTSFEQIGFKFAPTDVELMAGYLGPAYNGQPIRPEYAAWVEGFDGNLFQVHPSQLQEGAYYWYAPDQVTVQALDDGAIHGWRRDGRQTSIVDGGRRCGLLRFFQFDVNGAPAYRIKEYSMVEDPGDGGRLRLYKVDRLSRSPTRNRLGARAPVQAAVGSRSRAGNRAA